MKEQQTKQLRRWFKTRAYELRATKLRRIISLMLAGGIVLSFGYGFRYVYQEYASSRAEVSLYYPEIADGRYPDNSRFTYYDFVDLERVEEALSLMQEKGKYQNFTAEELRDHCFVYSMLDASVSDAVTYERSLGNNYSYVANEYVVGFFQPHDYKNKNILKWFFAKDESREFLETLMYVNNRYFVERFGGNAGFANITDPGNKEGCDYNEKVSMYRTQIDTIINNLNSLTSDNKKFSYQNITLEDLIGKYKALRTKLDTLKNFVESSGLTLDHEVALNKLNVNLEQNTLWLNKSNDSVGVNSYAQGSYDHTFTENIIVVALDDKDGLYQARPKTAFDRVVEQKHEAMEASAEYNAKISDINKTIFNYTQTALTPEEHTRLSGKYHTMQEGFDQEFQSLSQLANEFVSEFYDEINKDFLGYKTEKRQIFDKDFFTHLAICFCFGAVGVFVLYVLVSSYKDRRLQRKKEKIIQNLRNEAR